MPTVLKIKVHKSLMDPKEEITFVVRPAFMPGKSTEHERGD
jgi:hypothetical protein